MEKLSRSQALEQLLRSYAEQRDDLRIAPVLERILVVQMEQENSAQIIIACVNKLLQKNVTRWDGLFLLDKVLIHYPESLLNVNTVGFWTRVCLGVGVKEQVTVTRLSVLTIIVRLCSNTSDLNKLLIKELPKILSMCMTITPTPTVSEASLDCMKVCMQKYPIRCGPFKKEIESYLLKYLTCELNSSIIKKAGAAFNTLQQIGGSAPEGITYKTNWRNHIYKLCVTIHKQYDNFIPFNVESPSVPYNIVPYEFPELYEGKWNNSRLHKQVIILKNIIIFIEAMLLGGFPVEKCLKVSALLGVIKRGLSADMLGNYNKPLKNTKKAIPLLNANDKTFNEEQLEAALHIHHIHLLYLLKSFILRASPDLFINESIITKLLVDCLQHAKRHPFQNSKYLETVYDVLTDWINACKNIISRTAHKTLLLSILNDITPTEANLQLRLKEKTKTLEKDVTDSLSELQEVTCAAALKCGVALLRSVAMNTDDKKICEDIIKTVIKILINIQGKEIIYPYNKIQCQIYLYEILISILLQPLFFSKYNFIQSAIGILIKGQTKSYAHEVCDRGLTLLGKICQPIYPTMNINQEIDDDRLLISNKKRKKADDVNIMNHEIIEMTRIEDSPEELASTFLKLSSQKNQSSSAPSILEENNDNIANVNINGSIPLETGSSQSTGRINIISNVLMRDNMNTVQTHVDNITKEIIYDKEEESKKSILQMNIDEQSDGNLNMVEMDTNDLEETISNKIEIVRNTDRIMHSAEIKIPADETNEDELGSILASFNDIPNEDY